MKEIHFSTSPMIASAVDPFAPEWKKVNQSTISPFFKYSIFRFFIFLGSLLAFPIFIAFRCKYRVSLIKQNPTREVPSGTNLPGEANLSHKRCVYLPNFSTRITSNTCYLNSVLQAIFHNQTLQVLVRNSLEGDKRPFNLQLKTSLVLLFDAMEHGSKNDIAKAHLQFAELFITSKRWKALCLDGLPVKNREAALKKGNFQIGTQQDASTALEFILNTLEIYNAVNEVQKRVITEHFNPETNERIIKIKNKIHPMPSLNITPSGTVQEAITRAFTSLPEPMGLQRYFERHDVYQEVQVDKILSSLCSISTSISAGKREQILRQINAAELYNLTDNHAAGKSILRSLGIATIEDAKHAYIKNEHKRGIKVYKTEIREEITIDETKQTLMFKTQDQLTSINRNDGRFTPEDSITVNNRRYMLTGVINEEGNHYTFIKRNPNSWCRISYNARHKTNVDKWPNLDSIPGKGVNIQTVFYALVPMDNN